MAKEKKKIILTGATGTIGLAVIRKCLERGWEACVILRPNSPQNHNVLEHKDVHRIECDLSQLDRLYEADICKGADYFLHLGWNGTFGEERNQPERQNRNVQYALEACKVADRLGCEAFLFAGSQAEFGRVEGVLNSLVPPNPETAYGMAKLKAGMETRALCKQLGMRHLYFRILSVYGPGDGINTMIMSTINKLSRGISPEFTLGEQLWDYLYSDDAADALLAACEKGRSERIYCLGSGQARPLKEYIHIMSAIVNPDVSLGIGALPYGENQVMHLCADISDMKEDFGYEPKVSFEEGIKRILSDAL